MVIYHGKIRKEITNKNKSKYEITWPKSSTPFSKHAQATDKTRASGNV